MAVKFMGREDSVNHPRDGLRHAAEQHGDLDVGDAVGWGLLSSICFWDLDPAVAGFLFARSIGPLPADLLEIAAAASTANDLLFSQHGHDATAILPPFCPRPMIEKA
jgi:hypothetical protein